jgi:hypothetical protein
MNYFYALASLENMNRIVTPSTEPEFKKSK